MGRDQVPVGDEKADRGLVAALPSLKRRGVIEPDSYRISVLANS